MVELRVFRSIRSRLEPTRSQLPASTCLPLFNLFLPSVQDAGDVLYLPAERYRA